WRVRPRRGKVLPPRDGEFAGARGGSRSLADRRAKARSDREGGAAAGGDEGGGEGVLEQLVTRHSFEVPSSLVERRTDALLASLDVRLPEVDQQQALDQLRLKIRPRAEGQGRAGVLLGALAAPRGISGAEAGITT